MEMQKHFSLEVDVFEYYYSDDFSLSEIAEKLQISRQGVFKNLKQARSILDKYEKILNIAKKI